MPRQLESWITLQRTPVFSGGPIREICRESVRLPDGREIDDYYTAKMGDYALVYAVTDAGRVLLLRQYTHGVGRVCLTFPGGYVAPTEDALVGARRELLEETGYEASQWTHLGSYVTNANQGCNVAHLFRADGCRRVAAANAGDLEGNGAGHATRGRTADPAAVRRDGRAWLRYTRGPGGAAMSVSSAWCRPVISPRIQSYVVRRPSRNRIEGAHPIED